MSVDELHKYSRTFEKSCDRNRRELLDPGLFDPALDVQSRSFVMEINEKQPLTVGQAYLIRLEGERVVLQVDGRSVGKDMCAPPPILEALRNATWPVTTGVVVSYDVEAGIADVALRARGEAA